MRRDPVVGHVLDDAQLQHAALLLRQGVEQLVDALQPTLLGSDAGQVGTLEGAEPLPSAVFQALAPDRLQQHMARDAIQPGSGRAAGFVAECPPHAPGLRKCLCHEIERGFLIVTAAQVITLDPPRVAVIEDAKCPGVVHGGRQQLRVARSQLVHDLYMQRDPVNVTAPARCQSASRGPPR